MSLMRRLLLLASQSAWLCRRATRYWFMRRSVRRFMPGETAGEPLVRTAESVLVKAERFTTDEHG